MKNQLLRVSATGAVAAAILIGIGYNVISAQAAKGGPTIVGTWQVVVNPRVCATGAPLPVTFPAILTFNQGGTMTGTSTAVSSAFGIWDRKPGEHEYSFISISQRYSPMGLYQGVRRITQELSIGDDGNTFTTGGTFEDTDTNGALVASGCSTSVGTRFQ